MPNENEEGIQPVEPRLGDWVQMAVRVWDEEAARPRVVNRWALPDWMLKSDKKPQEGKRGEELFQLILSSIREIYEIDGVIAGGAVRDLAAGVTNHKDVDVFLPLTYDLFSERVEELGWQGPWKRVGEGYKDCVIPSTARISHIVQNCPVDLVLMDQPLTPELVDKFPVHAQRCVWTLAEGQSLSPEAVKDLDNKQFTIDPTITDKERFKKILTKINGWKKRPEYKDWKIVEPDVKEWWEAKEQVAKKKEPLVRGSPEWADAYLAGLVDPYGNWKDEQ